LKIESVIGDIQRLGNPLLSCPSGRISQTLLTQPDFDAKIFKNAGEFETYYKIVSDERWKMEEKLSTENKDKHSWFTQGYCEVCDKKTEFKIERNNPKGTTPMYRSTLTCRHCALMNRRRFIAALLKKLMNGGDIKDVYVYERITQFYKVMQEQLKNVNLVGSEYLGSDKKPGEIVKKLKVQNKIINDVRHEDALKLSFDDKSFDLVVSQDVFEHVSDINKSLKEAHRVLRNHGCLIIAIPFTFAKTTVQRAMLKDGKIQNLLPAAYHGNPLSKNGALVFFDYGWDFLDMCKSAGFTKAYMVGYYSLYYGYIGRALQVMFIAEK